MADRDQRRTEHRRGARRPGRSPLGMWLIVAVVGLGLVGLAAGLIAMSGGGGGRFPEVGDHWHADYSIAICGKTLPNFPEGAGGVHTHNDGVIHLEVAQPTEAGQNAHLARFVASIGGRLTDTSLHLPSGEEYANGDPCPDGRTGQMFLRVNGTAVTDIASYVPQDGDRIDLGFGAQ